MGITVTTQPAVVSLAGNDILFNLETSLDPGTYSGVSIHVTVKYLDDAGSWQIAGQDIKAVVNQAAPFYIQSYLKGINQVPVTVPGSVGLYAHPYANTKYKIAYYETYIVTATGETVTTAEVEDPGTWYAVQGGISRMDEIQLKTVPYANWWAMYLVEKPFLTHRPNGEYFSANQTLKLGFINLPGSNLLTLKVEITDNVGSTSTKTIKSGLAVVDYEYIEADISPQLIFTAPELADMASFRVIIDSNLGADYYATKTYTLLTRYFERNDYFIYQNSFGSWDGVWARGYRNESADLDYIEFAKSVRFADEIERPESQKERAFATEKYAASFGFRLNAIRDLSVLQEFFMSNQVYYIYGIGTAVLPIAAKVITKKTTGLSDGQDLYSSPFTFELSFKDQYYSSFRI